MNEKWEQARQKYRQTETPPELEFAVASALRAGEKKRQRRRSLRRSLSAGLAACACFVLLINASPTFARAVANVPVLGDLYDCLRAQKEPQALQAHGLTLLVT